MIQSPIQIASRGLTLHEWWREKILRRARKLDEFFDRITACRIVAESRHRHHRRVRLYTVRIDIEIPGHVIVINREPDRSFNAAVDRAFDAAERRLEDAVRLLRGSTKHHEPVPSARVVEVHAEEGFGFLETEEGRRVYFHRNSVLGGEFDRLTPGSAVSFAEERGEEGPQASTVKLVRAAPRVERRRARRRHAALPGAA